MYEITTETGAKYLVDIDRQFWMKISRDGYKYPWERTWRLEHGRVGETVTDFPWVENSGWKPGLPEVGDNLYISCRDSWWISTPVVSIEEVEDEV